MVLRAGGTVGAGAVLTHAAPPVSRPFATARYVEGRRIRAIDVGGPQPPPSDTVFVDGIQRYAVEGRFGLVPVVRGYVAAAAARREAGRLQMVDHRAEEFLVVALARVAPRVRRALETLELPLYDCTEGERAHPILDVQYAAKVVERRRETLEARLAEQLVSAGVADWLVVDGSIAHLEPGREGPPLLGLVKSHETQFLTGRDLEVALTLPAGSRSSVFARSVGQRVEVHTWYLRLWPWEEHDLLHGLVRIERPAAAAATPQATAVSRWVLAERAPLTAPDARWDRLVYPMHYVETFLRAQAGGW